MTFSRSIGSRRLVGIFGVSGTGKTQTLRTVVRDWRRRFCFDRSAELAKGIDVEATCATRDEVSEYLDGLKPDEDFSVAYQPYAMEPEEEAEECGWLAEKALDTMDCVLTVDEASRSCRHRLVHPSTVQVALEGRKLGVSMIVASQRPTHVDPDIRGEAYGSEVFLFAISREDDLKDMGKEVGRAIAAKVAALPDLSGFHVRRSSAGGMILEAVTVIPDTHFPELIYSAAQTVAREF